MKKTLPTFLVFLFLSASLFSQSFIPIDDQSQIKFEIKNFGINTPGSFKGLKGEIKFNFSNPESSLFKITIDAKTVNTGIDLRDEHLQNQSYFYTEKFPIISIISTKVESVKGQEGSFIIFARLSMKGKTKDVTFPFTAEKQNDGVLFKGNFSLNRKDFDIGGGSAVMGSNVDLTLKVFAKKL